MQILRDISETMNLKLTLAGKIALLLPRTLPTLLESVGSSDTGCTILQNTDYSDHQRRKSKQSTNFPSYLSNLDAGYRLNYSEPKQIGAFEFLN